MTNLKELQQQIVLGMKRWEKIEDAALTTTSRVMEGADNPFIRLVMEVIQRDTHMHHRIQEWIAHSIEDEAAVLTYEHMDKVWKEVERHKEVEEQMMAMVKEMLAAVEGKRMVMQEYLLNFLLDDETKHVNLLDRLEQIKKGLLP
jgi:ferric iron reductase protein FhuF